MEAPSSSSEEAVASQVAPSEEVVATQVAPSSSSSSEDGGEEIAPEAASASTATTSRPSLDEVWESIKHNEPPPPPQLQQEEEKVVVSEVPKPVPVPEVKERARPSSLRTRPRTGAKRSVTFKDDFGRVDGEDEEKVHRPRRQVQARGQEQPGLLPPACMGLFLALALASLVVYVASPKIPTKPQLWTSAELGKYNGSDNKPPLLLGILGSVFDVSKGWKHYGPGGSYHHFVGRDASRAFVSGNFTDDGLIDSLEGLTPSQIKVIDDWRLFFLSRYIYLGKLVGTFYNSEGAPTKKLHLAEKEVKKAAQLEKQQKLDEERFPNCNSRWTQDQGGEVWCTDGKYPRIIEMAMATQGPKKGPSSARTRCACLAPEELQHGGLVVAGVQEYDGCDALSSRCKT